MVAVVFRLGGRRFPLLCRSRFGSPAIFSLLTIITIIIVIIFLIIIIPHLYFLITIFFITIYLIISIIIIIIIFIIIFLCLYLSFILHQNHFQLKILNQKLHYFRISYNTKHVNSDLSYLLLRPFWKYATSFGKKIYSEKIYLQIRGQEVNLYARLSYLLFWKCATYFGKKECKVWEDLFQENLFANTWSGGKFMRPPQLLAFDTSRHQFGPSWPGLHYIYIYIYICCYISVWRRKTNVKKET